MSLAAFGLSRALESFRPADDDPPDVVVRLAVSAVLHVESGCVQQDSRLADLAPFDSLHLLEIVSALDHHFDFRLPTDTLSRKIAVSHLTFLTVTALAARGCR